MKLKKFPIWDESANNLIQLCTSMNYYLENHTDVHKIKRSNMNFWCFMHNLRHQILNLKTAAVPFWDLLYSTDTTIQNFNIFIHLQVTGTEQETQVSLSETGNIKLILTQSYLVISMKASVNVILDGGTWTFPSVTTRVLGWKKALNPSITTKVLHLKNKNIYFILTLPSAHIQNLL